MMVKIFNDVFKCFSTTHKNAVCASFHNYRILTKISDTFIYEPILMKIYGYADNMLTQISIN